MNIVEFLNSDDAVFSPKSFERDIPGLGKIDIYPLSTSERFDLGSDTRRIDSGELSEESFCRKWFSRILLGPDKNFSDEQFNRLVKITDDKSEWAIMTAGRYGEVEEAKKP